MLYCFFMWQERLFLETQAERLEKTMRQLADQHRQKIALLESQFLQQKQQLLRGEKTPKPHCLHDTHGPHAYRSHQIKMFFVPWRLGGGGREGSLRKWACYCAERKCQRPDLSWKGWVCCNDWCMQCKRQPGRRCVHAAETEVTGLCVTSSVCVSVPKQ